MGLTSYRGKGVRAGVALTSYQGKGMRTGVDVMTRHIKGVSRVIPSSIPHARGGNPYGRKSSKNNHITLMPHAVVLLFIVPYGIRCQNYMQKDKGP